MDASEQIRQAVFARQRKRWEQIQSPGSFGRLLQAVFGKNPAKGLFIVEFDAVDQDTFQCCGNPLSAWRLDDNGLIEITISEVTTGNLIKNRIWEFQLVKLFVSDDAEHVFLNEIDGPKQGMLIYLRPKRSSNGVSLKVQSAKPILGGHVVG